MHTKLHICVFVLATLVPCAVFAASPLVIEDTIAGIGTEATVHAEPGEQLTLRVIPPGEKPFSLTVKTGAQGGGAVFIPGTNTEHAGTYDATLLNGEQTIASARFDILPDSVDPRRSRINIRHDVIAANGRDAADATVILQDRYGNALSGRPVELIGSGNEDIVPLTSETGASGEQRFRVTTTVPGTITLRAMDLLSTTVLEGRGIVEAGSSYGMGGGRYQADLVEVANAETPEFDEIDRFQITVDPAKLAANEVARNVLIQAVDRFGKIVRDYTGTVRIYSPTDPRATLPGFEQGYGEVTFSPRERGEKNLRLVVSFQKPGKQKLRVEDRANPNEIISGETTVTVGGGGVDPMSGTIQVTSHKNEDVIGRRSIILAGTGDPFVNLIVMINGVDSAQGDTDQTGAFSIPIDIDPSIIGDFSVRIQDENRIADSGPITLTLDTVKPEIISVTFTPEEPEENTDLLLVVNTEPEAEVTMTLKRETKTLTEDRRSPGSFQVLLKAPAPGPHQAAIVVKDKAGNSTELRAPLNVSASGLPQVLHVRAEGRANAVELKWDPMNEEKIDAFRIYVGEAEGEFSYTLDTNRATVSATVAGLRPATEYFFAVTALQGERESGKKSETVSAIVLGTKMEVTEQANALFLAWSFPNTTPLTSFLLEYGIEEGTYTERRLLNGGLRAFTLRDLLGGVMYHLRLTPVTTTGDMLADLAASGRGTPSSSEGFHPASSGGIPFDPDDLAPPDTLHEGAAEVTSVGLPPVAFFGGLAFALAALAFHWHRRRALLTTEFLAAMERRYRG